MIDEMENGDGSPMPSISTGLVEAAPTGRPARAARAVALAAATVLIGGAGYLALRAGGAVGGADSPEEAMRGALSALSQEDLLGAAEFVEPTERELLIDAGVDVAAELSRLGVLAVDLDLSSVPGIDLELSDLDLSSATVAPDLAHVYVDGGRVSGSVDVDELPLGPLVLDRAPPEWLEQTVSESELVEPSDTPVAVVRRDGRWYLSLWYSVAENARLSADLALPDAGDRVTAVGGATPQAAVMSIVAAATELDLAGVIAMLDPDETAALYDYAGLFLDDAQAAVDEWTDTARGDGWQWRVEELDLSSETAGDLAEVRVDAFRFAASGPEVELDAAIEGESMRMSVVDDYSTIEVVADGTCTTITVDEAGERETDRICLDDLGTSDVFAGGVIANLQGVPQAGVMTHRVDGRWYVSPSRTGSNGLLSVLAAIEPEALADTVDALIDLVEDETVITADLWEEAGSAIAPVPTTTMPVIEALTRDNLDLLVGGQEVLLAYDLDPVRAAEQLAFWIPDADPGEFTRGLYAEVLLGEISITEPNVAVVVLLEPVDPASVLRPLEGVVPGVHVDDEVVPHIRTESSWGDPALASFVDGRLVIVGTFDGQSSPELLEVLRRQAGR